MKILVTGAGGQLGRDLVDVLRERGDDVIAATRREMDYTDIEHVADFVIRSRPDWVVNCAAYTQVDKAESDEKTAFLVNESAAGKVAQATTVVGAGLLHLSTDFVFGGSLSTPLTEEDPVNPLSVYGRSKLAGERQVLQSHSAPIILRAAWIHGARGHNFVKTILRLAAEREELRVVDDQIGTPTWTRDICHAIESLIQNRCDGVFHFTNEGVASWYDFAVAIVEEAGVLDFPIKVQHILPIATSEYQTPAQRPAYTVLSKRKIRRVLGAPIPHWRQGLRGMLKELHACEQS